MLHNTYILHYTSNITQHNTSQHTSTPLYRDSRKTCTRTQYTHTHTLQMDEKRSMQTDRQLPVPIFRERTAEDYLFE